MEDRKVKLSCFEVFYEDCYVNDCKIQFKLKKAYINETTGEIITMYYN